MSDLAALPFTDGSFDAAASDAVYEHSRDLGAVLAETVRVLRPGGTVYATYGPLWYGFGGDHFSGVGGLEHGYAHLDGDRERYLAYVHAHADPAADAQGGVRYIELDLFSRLTTRQYLAAFAQAGLDVVDLMLEISANAVAFRRRWPEKAYRLAGQHGISADDLLIKANFVLLRKPHG